MGSDEIKRKLRTLLGVTLAVICLDQVSKFWAVSRLTHSFSRPGGGDFERFWRGDHPIPTEPVVVIDPLWDFVYVENPGAAWGLLAGANEAVRGPFFVVVSLVAATLVLRYYFRSPPRLRLRALALSLVFGGAVGNFIDRVRLRYVIDFIHWHWRQVYHFPTFNIADAAISVGVVLLLVDSFKNTEAPAEPL